MARVKEKKKSYFETFAEIKFSGNDNYGKPKSKYIARLRTMTPEELRKETENKIWLSAYAGNNPRSDFHWQCDACYGIYDDAGNAKGYDDAYQSVKRGLGY